MGLVLEEIKALVTSQAKNLDHRNSFGPLVKRASETKQRPYIPYYRSVDKEKIVKSLFLPFNVPSLG